MTEIDIKDLVRNNEVKLDRYHRGNLYYRVSAPITKENVTTWVIYEFPVPINDCGDGEFLRDDKAMMFMRYIRKAIDNQELRKI